MDAGRRATVIEADLSDLDSISSLAAQAGDVDILINNAAGYGVTPTLDQTMQALDDMFAVMYALLTR